MPASAIMALDVGEKRIGIALADGRVRIAVPLATIEVDGKELDRIAQIAKDEQATRLVVGYPRNQSGEPTRQTHYVTEFARRLETIGLPIDFQDESLTSVQAEARLEAQGKPYKRAEIDSMAASIFLQDYLEAQYGRV